MSTGDHTLDRSLESQQRDIENGLHSGQPRPNNLVNHSRIPTLSPRHGAKPRITFSNTRTLKGAFQAAGSMPAGSDDDRRMSRRYSLGRERKPSAMSPDSEISSPPGELLETYQRINAADNLVELVYDFPSDQARLDRIQHLSPTPGTRQQASEDIGAGDIYDSDLSFLEDAVDESFRKKFAKHTADEQRLKLVTRKDSPVFSKAKVGSTAALLTEIPQRRIGEEEIDQEVEPSLNIPKSWGTRGKVPTDWLSKINRMNGNNRLENDSEQLPAQEWENDIDFTARSLQVSDSPPLRNNFQTKEEIENLAKKGLTTNILGEIKRRASQEQMQPSADGTPILNTPVVVYKSSNREKATILERGDSQELLRRLARTESPSSISTPEQKPSEKSALAAKTPIVTGAWIDTPMPDRIADLPEKGSKDTIPRNNKVPQSPSQTQAEIQKPPTKPQLNPPRASTAKLEKPKLPKSALETVIEDARSGDHSLDLGENTIESLQDLLDGMPTFRELKDEDTAQSEESEGECPDIPLETDTVVIHRLNLKLQSLVRSINDATALLTNLEHRVSKDVALLTSRKATQTEKDHSHRHGSLPCESCSLQGDGRLYITFPIPRLWRRQPDTNRLRPSRFSWFLLILSTWYLAEFIMCDYYCHPFYASTCERNCLDPNAPRMPYVIPTMLWRWSHLSVVLTPVWTILVALIRFMAQLLGLWDGFVDVPSLWGDAGDHNVHVGAAWDQRVSGPDLSMMNDEYM